jgi:uncharacterized protein (DUF4415 family)
MKKESSRRPTAKQRAEVVALAKLADAQIDTRDIPEVKDWSDARRSLLYRPLKQQLTLRVDRDVVAWFRTRATDGEGYQTDMNRALREHIRRHARRRKAG